MKRMTMALEEGRTFTSMVMFAVPFTAFSMALFGGVGGVLLFVTWMLR